MVESIDDAERVSDQKHPDDGHTLASWMERSIFHRAQQAVLNPQQSTPIPMSSNITFTFTLSIPPLAAHPADLPPSLPHPRNPAPSPHPNASTLPCLLSALPRPAALPDSYLLTAEALGISPLQFPHPLSSTPSCPPTLPLPPTTQRLPFTSLNPTTPPPFSIPYSRTRPNPAEAPESTPPPNAVIDELTAPSPPLPHSRREVCHSNALEIARGGGMGRGNTRRRNRGRSIDAWVARTALVDRLRESPSVKFCWGFWIHGWETWRKTGGGRRKGFL